MVDFKYLLPEDLLSIFTPTCNCLFSVFSLFCFLYLGVAAVTAKMYHVHIIQSLPLNILISWENYRFY